MKRPCSSSLDRISELPCHITQTILAFLPLEDMVRTSILSRNWIFQWTKVPQLLFDPCKMYTVERIFGILLQHQGPILKFLIYLKGWQHGSDVNKVISFLGRNGIQELLMYIGEEDFKVPSSIFSCVELKHLTLGWCIFKPLTFQGFHKLITLELSAVNMDSYVSISSCPSLESLTMDIHTRIDQFSIDAPKLKVWSFRGSISDIGLMNTPLLQVVSFNGDEEKYCRRSKFDLMKLLCSLPLLEDLLLYHKYLKLLAVGVSTYKVPSVLNNLKKLELSYVTLNDERELSSTLWLLRNSPYLQKIKLEHPQSDGPKHELSSMMQGYSDFHMTKLQEVEMVFYDAFDYAWPAIEILKFLLAASPELEKLYIRPSSDLHKRQYNMVGELISYRRASRKAEIVFK